MQGDCFCRSMSGNAAVAGIDKRFLFVSTPQLNDEELSWQFGSSNSISYSQYILVDKSPGVSVKYFTAVGRKTKVCDKFDDGWDLLACRDQAVLSCPEKRVGYSSNVYHGGKTCGVPCPAQERLERLCLPSVPSSENHRVSSQRFQRAPQPAEVNLQNQLHKLHLGSLERRGVSYGNNGVTAEKPEKLGEALCHSQTRARNAEKLATDVLVEKEQLAKLVFREARACRTYKERVQLLELENSWLKTQGRELSPASYNASGLRSHCKFYKKGMSMGGTLVPGTIGLAFALGLTCASAGFMIGCCMGLFGFSQ